MKFTWQKSVFQLALSVGSVMLLSACSGDLQSPPAAGDGNGDEYVDDGSGVVLGASWQSLSYPYCFSAASDPDGDGWGWEFNRSCIVYKPPPPPAPPPPPPPSGGGSSGGGSGASCPNAEGTASTMAAVAVSAAMEMKRWQPTKDFAIGRVSNQEALVISATGKARCADGVCMNTQALLDFQKEEAANNIVFPGGVKLVPVALRSRMVAKYRDQIACEMQPSNGGTTNCPVEEHTLTFQRSEKGGCDTNFFFVAKKPDGTPLKYPAQLKNKLLWADRTNQYIGFQNVGEVVSIDPTWGLNEAGSTSSGACSVACVRVSREDVSGDCCSCLGSTGTFKKALWNASTYLCQ
jgi:cellulose binding protein with CBM10 domain